MKEAQFSHSVLLSGSEGPTESDAIIDNGVGARRTNVELAAEVAGMDAFFLLQRQV